MFEIKVCRIFNFIEFSFYIFCRDNSLIFLFKLCLETSSIHQRIELKTKHEHKRCQELLICSLLLFVYVGFWVFVLLKILLSLHYWIVYQVLEIGIVVHSVIIGLSLGTAGSIDTIKPLLVALSFHQFFEGMGLGGCISQVLQFTS